MKMMKKIATMLLVATFLIPVFGSQVEAADGVLMFSDPQTKVGENVSVDLVVKASDQTIGDVDVTMTYDPTALEFVSGNGVTSDGNGTLTFSHKGSGSETEVRTTMEFRALKQGEAQINVSGHTAYLFSNETLTLTEGSSVVTIDVGADGSTSVEPSTATAATPSSTKISVDGKEYSFSETFPELDIPEGYTEKMLTYDGAERKFVANQAGVTLGYLVDEVGEGRFFLYNEENATFSPFVEIYISESTAIVLLDKAEEVSLPEQYQQAELQVEDYVFPAWQDMEHDGYYAMYVLNTKTGQKELYQYDTVDGTYQRLIKPEKQEKEEDAVADTKLGKIQEFVTKNFLPVMILVVGLGLLLLIVLIIISVKLYHRNAELDDLYDEYGIDLEPEGDPSKKSKERKEIQMEDDFDEEYGEEFDDAFEDEFLDDEYDDFEDDIFGNDFEVEYDEFDEEEIPTQKTVAKNSPKKKGKASKKADPYDIDFIDL